MIAAGITLAVVGMGVVFVFLILLVLVISVSSRILATRTAEELAHALAAAQKKPSGDERGGRLIAAISAALAAHRSLRQK